MKREFSNNWRGSKLPRKQRKFVANAPLHIRHKLMSSHLSKELRKKHGKRNLPLRKGDTIKIMNGEYKKKTGKVLSVDLKKTKVLIDGIFKSKKDGTKIKVYFHPSNLMITELYADDKKRNIAIQRKNLPTKTTETKKTEKGENKDAHKSK